MVSPNSLSTKENKRLRNNCLVKLRRDSILSDKKKEMLFEVVKCQSHQKVQADECKFNLEKLIKF
jgi:hypothetical protein